ARTKTTDITTENDPAKVSIVASMCLRNFRAATISSNPDPNALATVSQTSKLIVSCSDRKNPTSARLELAAFVLFQRSVRRHRKPEPSAKTETWMILVVASTFGFLAALIGNAALCLIVALGNSGPAFPHGLDQRLLVLSSWGFLVPRSGASMPSGCPCSSD